VKRSRRPIVHPLASVFWRAVESIALSLAPDTVRAYRAATRHFLNYLGAHHPEINALDQLRRDPHILGWLSSLRAEVPPLVLAAYVNKLIRLRRIFEELAWLQQIPDLVHLLRREDTPRAEKCLPRAFTSLQDQLIQKELLRRNDLPSNVMLLLRHTGMRIGECVDLTCDCLRSTGPDQWAIQVPLGKTRTERMVPVDSFVRELVQRLRFLRTLDPFPADGLLLARPRGREMLTRELRRYLREIASAVGICTRIVPHQFRHTYATEMLFAGVTMPNLMKLLGHSSADMTMRYLKITMPDVQREFHLARSQPRHLAPQPKSPSATVRADLPGVVESLRSSQHVLEMFRRTLPDGRPRRRLERLPNRLTKIVAEALKLAPPEK
jgi:site-specific recombinase XerD